VTDDLGVTTPRHRDPDLATLIASPLASRIRDDNERSTVVRAVRAALRERGHRRVEVVETGDPAAIREAAAAAVLGGSTTVVLAGGDGTIRDAAPALTGSGVAVGLVPCGTGNLYAASVGVPRGIEDAVAVLATGTPGPFDVGDVQLERGGEVESAHFVVACGTGFDARVIGATSREAKQRYGVAAYFLAASRLLAHLRPLSTVLTVDGVRTELESVVVLVANSGEAIPGKLRPRLPIRADDGLLHVFVLPQGGVLGGVRGVLELMTAQTAGVSPSGAAVRFAGRTVRVEVDPPGPVEVDGDPYRPAAIEASVHAGGFVVIRP
jgi:diacylglycerol kinase family enzyme